MATTIAKRLKTKKPSGWSISPIDSSAGVDDPVSAEHGPPGIDADQIRGEQGRYDQQEHKKLEATGVVANPIRHRDSDRQTGHPD